MTTVETTQLQDAVDGLQQSAAAALENNCPDGFGQFERQLSRLDAACREVQQALWADDAWATIERLEANDPLTETDKEVLHAFLISDAERYLAMENNYQDWVAELQRLIADIVKRAHVIDRRSIADLRGVVKDAVRLAPDIRNYLEERSRIDRCYAALDSLDDESRKLLVRILKEDVSSPNR